MRRLPLPDADWTVPVWHPDGEALVINKPEDGGSQLWLIPLDGSAPTQLTHGPGNHLTAYGRAWGPKGLLYSSDESGEQELYLLNPTTFAATRLGWTGGDNLAPSWSGDGTAFVFMRRDYGAARWDLWIATPRGKLGRVTLSIDSSGDAAQAAWSPDGKRILFQYGRERDWHLWMANADGITKSLDSTDPMNPITVRAKVTPFVVSPGSQSDATWVGRSSDVLFTDRDTPQAAPRIYVMAGGVVERLADAKQGFSMVSASPDGKRIAFVAGRLGARSVFVADVIQPNSAP